VAKFSPDAAARAIGHYRFTPSDNTKTLFPEIGMQCENCILCRITVLHCAAFFVESLYCDIALHFAAFFLHCVALYCIVLQCVAVSVLLCLMQRISGNKPSENASVCVGFSLRVRSCSHCTPPSLRSLSLVSPPPPPSLSSSNAYDATIHCSTTQHTATICNDD